MQLTSVISTRLDKMNRRLVKILRFGKSDVLEPFQANNFGLDSNPPKGMVAVYSPTSEIGKNVIIGYLNKDQLAKPGETRIYATNADGALKFYAWFKDDGTLELGGDSNFAVKFNELKSAFNSLQKSHNDLLTEYKTHVHPGVQSGASSTSVTTSIQNPNSADIDTAKNSEIKTN